MGQALWVREAAEFEPEGDNIICRWGEVEWVLSPAVAHMVASRLNRALAEHHAAQTADIIRFPDHAASS
jgi:hypothetical protein